MTQIRVCGTPYNVVVMDLPDGIHGLCDSEEHTISISSEITGEKHNEVLLHEVIHAVMFETGLQEFLNDKLHEALCVALSKHLPKAGYRRV